MYDATLDPLTMYRSACTIEPEADDVLLCLRSRPRVALQIHDFSRGAEGNLPATLDGFRALQVPNTLLLSRFREVLNRGCPSSLRRKPWGMRPLDAALALQVDARRVEGVESVQSLDAAAILASLSAAPQTYQLQLAIAPASRHRLGTSAALREPLTKL